MKSKMLLLMLLISVVSVSGCIGKGQCWWWEGKQCWWFNEPKIAFPCGELVKEGDKILPKEDELMISSKELLSILDDNGDGEIATTPGDNIANDPLLIDLRSKEDYDAGHIAGAIWVCDWYEITKKENLNKIKNKLFEHKGAKYIVVYDYNGKYSGIVTSFLAAAGFEVKNLGGYCTEWYFDPATCSQVGFPQPILGGIAGVNVTANVTKPPEKKKPAKKEQPTTPYVPLGCG